jgi:nitrite reductase/ring-hydroxylating ferredoxin subunit
LVDVFDTGIRPSELDPARPRPIETPWGSYSLYVVHNRVRAAQSFCPHLEGPLFQGTLSGETITCPWHEWRFSLVTGARVDLAGRLFPSGARLSICPVSLSPHGTIVLWPPERAQRPA